MSVTSVVGLQWGDEAKGKIVDFLTDSHEIVVRYQGGNNAGHTVKFDGQTFKLSLLPTGILRPGVAAVIGNGLVVNPEALLNEMKSLTDRGVRIDGANLLVSDRAHVILPYHIVEDKVFEQRRGDHAIGTTGRGIGTCYRDKAGRSHAIRVGDLYHPETIPGETMNEIVAFKQSDLGQKVRSTSASSHWTRRRSMTLTRTMPKSLNHTSWIRRRGCIAL